MPLSVYPDFDVSNCPRELTICTWYLLTVAALNWMVTVPVTGLGYALKTCKAALAALPGNFAVTVTASVLAVDVPHAFAAVTAIVPETVPQVTTKLPVP